MGFQRNDKKILIFVTVYKPNFFYQKYISLPQ